MLIYGYKGEAAVDGCFPAVAVHFFYVDVYVHLQTGISYFAYLSYQFHDGACGDGFVEIDFVAGDGHYFFPAKSSSGDKGHLVHHMHGCASEKGVVVVGSVGKHRLENAGSGSVYSFLYVHSLFFIGTVSAAIAAAVSS